MINDVQRNEFLTLSPRHSALLSGITLFLSDYPLHIWPLHFVALVPLLVVLLKVAPNRVLSTQLGLSFASSYAGPLLFSVGLAPPVIVAAALLKVPDLFLSGGMVIGPSLFGALCSAGAAYFSIRFLTRYFETKTLTPFALYCVVAGGTFLLLLSK